MRTEPDALLWTVQRASGFDPPVPGPEAWGSAIPALQSSRLAPLAAHLLGETLSTLPPRLRQFFESARMAAESQAETAARQVREVAQMLDEAGVAWVVLKGWPLATELYPEPWCRPSGDLDLLVAEADVPFALSALARAGYQVEGGDHSYHRRLLRDDPVHGTAVIELHHHPGPPSYAGPVTGAILASRRELATPAGPAWIPGPEYAMDLLVRHYLRHGGYQGILLLDIALLADDTVRHPLGAPVGDDLERVGLSRRIDGPSSFRVAPLRRWLRRRTFAERRSARHIARVGIPLALCRSSGGIAAAMMRLAWPARPTPRWTGSDGDQPHWTWRWKRLMSAGVGPRKS